MWSGLAILLLTEVLFLTLRFDTTAFAVRSDMTGRIVSAAPEVLRVAIGTAAVCLLLLSWRLWNRFGPTVRELGLTSSLRVWLPLHLASFSVVTWATDRTIGAPTRAMSAEVFIWLSAAAALAFSWLAAAIPPRFWSGLIWKARGVLLGGTAIGIGTWAVGRFVRTAWESSAAPTFWLADCFLRLVYSEVVSDPARFVLGTPSFQIRIASACSGYEGVCLVSVYLSFYIVLFRRSLCLPRAVWLVPIGAVSAWMLNVVRIAALVAIGDSGSPELALGGFHSQAGWLAFNAVALGLIFVAHRSRLFATLPRHEAAEPNATAPYLLPLLVLVFGQMLAEAFFNGSAALYPLRVVAGAAVLFYFRQSMRDACRGEASDSERQGSSFAVLVGVVVFALWIVLNQQATENHVPDPRGAMDNESFAVWLVFRVVGSVLVVPLAEELAFRGYLLRRLIAADFDAVSPRRFTWVSFAISSLLFGLLHGHWIAGTLAGMAYATVLYRRGRLSDCVIAHATTNGLLAVTALSTGDWSFWS